jgi:hypothetical protein
MYRYRSRRGNSLNPLAALLIVIGVVAVYLAFDRLSRPQPLAQATPTVAQPTQTQVVTAAQLRRRRRRRAASCLSAWQLPT